MLLAQLQVKPGKEKAFEDEMRRQYGPTIAEPNNTMYHTFRTAKQGEYYCYMGFDSYAGFIAHQVSPHHDGLDWFDLVDDMKIHWLDPVEGATTQTSPTQFVDQPDASERERWYIDRFVFERASWWPRL